MSTFYQVVGARPCMIDHPTGDSVSYRPGQIFEASPTLASVQRALRVRAVRELSPREVGALRAQQAMQVKLKAGLPPAAAAKVEEAKAAMAKPENKHKKADSGK